LIAIPTLFLVFARDTRHALRDTRRSTRGPRDVRLLILEPPLSRDTRYATSDTHDGVSRTQHATRVVINGHAISRARPAIIDTRHAVWNKQHARKTKTNATREKRYATRERADMQNDDMKVVTVMTRKGGAGKTTLLQAIVSAAVKDKQRCLVLDADPQQALYRWFNRLEIDEPLVKVQQLEFSSDLDNAIEAAWKAGDTDLVFVDTQGAAGAWADDLAASSDYLVVPMKLAEKDLSITKDTFNWYVGLRDRTDDPAALPSLRIIFADVPTKPTMAQEGIEKEALRLFPIMDNYFMHRNQHLDADAQGFLHVVAERRRESRYGLLRTHAKYFDEAVDEARDILKEILGGK